MNEIRPDAAVMRTAATEAVPSAGPVARLEPGRLVAWYPRLAARLQSLFARGVTHLRSVRLDRLPRVSRATGVAVLLLVASGALWLSTVVPMSRNVEMLQAEVATLESAARSGTAIARSPAAQAETFIKGLPTRNDLPSIMTVIITQATNAGLELPSGEYQFTPTRSGQIGRYRIAFPVRGTYPQLREFIDGTLTALPAVALESLRLERESIGETVLEAELQFAVIVRGTT
jgi:Tfp pilus assembly protein PilO